MGAFVLFRKNSDTIDTETILNVFAKKGFSNNSLQFDLQSYKLVYYSKIKVKTPQVIKTEDELLLGVGTFIYKKKWGQDALYEILNSIKRNDLKLENIYGNYFFIHFIRDGLIHFYPSPSYSYNVFYNNNEEIFSSSFLAVFGGINKKFNVNHLAVTELLLTGNLAGPDTLINEIYRIENFTSFISKNFILHSTKPESFEDYHTDNVFTGFNQAVDFQLQNLNKYFQSTKNFILKNGICLGITGGFDSRLLLGYLIQNELFPEIYSTWRKEITNEFLNATKVAEKLGLKLNTQEHDVWSDIDREDFLDLLDHNLWFNDGLIRKHQLWTEEIKSRYYLVRLVNEKYINSSGVGGEQYRNNLRIKINNIYDINAWLKYEILLKYTDDPFYNNYYLNQSLNYLKSKYLNILGKETTNKIDYLTIKRYYNEIYNPSNRTIRNNIENQLYYFLSPFTDYNISRNAYAAIPWLGADFEFEKAMINKVNPELASINTDYGFKPNGKVILKQRSASLLKANLPFNVFWRLYRMRGNRSTYLSDMEKRFYGFDKYRKRVMGLDLPIDISIIAESSNLAPLILELGYFIDKFESKIR